MTADEMQQLALIERALSDDDPGLACRLRRMATVSLETTRIAIGALVVLLVGAAAFVAVGAAVAQPVFLVVGVLAAAAAPVSVTAWRLWVSRYHRAASAETRPFQCPPLPR